MEYLALDGSALVHFLGVHPHNSPEFGGVFYAVRGGAQNTAYLERHLIDLVTQLQYTGGDIDDT